MKISVITPRFSLAGVPLAQIRFSQALASLGHEVSLVIGHINKGYNLPNIEGVDVRVLGKERAITMIGAITNHLRIHKPDVVFSAEDHLNVVVLISAWLSNSKSKISCSSRVTPFDTYSNKILSKRWILKQLMKLFMHRATALTCVSKDMVKQYQEVFDNPPHINVYNIVNDRYAHEKKTEIVTDPWFDSETPMVIAAGRLALWKGFADLIRAVSLLNKTKEVRLTILGGGPLKSELEQLIKDLNMESLIRLQGYVENTLKYFNKSEIFVLSSYVEGLPNVLVEAMMCGCTPVSTDCPTGPREVLADGKYGYMVPVGDVEAMASAIGKALTSPIPKKNLELAVEPFSDKNVLESHRKSLQVSRSDFYPRE